MKIAMMTNSYKPFVAGVPVSIERLSQGLREIGHEVVIFAPSYKEQKEEENVVRYHSLVKGIANGFSVPNVLDAKIERQFRQGKFTEYANQLERLLMQDRRYLEQGALETARKYEMREIAKWAAFYYNKLEPTGLEFSVQN